MNEKLSPVRARKAYSKRSGAAIPWILLVIILLGFALRLYRLGFQSLWYDETVSLLLAQKDVVSLTSHTAGDIHPPFYYYLLHFWIGLVGKTEFAAAFLSLAFGILLIPLVQRVGKAFFNSTVGLIAAGLVAVSPYNLWYSQEVRMYTLGAFLGLASVYFMMRLRPGTRLGADRGLGLKLASNIWPWMGYVLTAVLGLYTLYYFFFLILFQNLYVFARWLLTRRIETRAVPEMFFRPPIPRWLAGQAAIFVLYLPWLPIAYRQATEPPVPPWRSFVLLGQVLLESWTALSLGQSADPYIVWPILLLMAALYVAGLLSKRNRDSQSPTPGSLLLGYTFVPLMAIYLFSLWKPLYHVRYIFTYSPAFYLLLAAGLARLGRSSIVAATVCLGVIVGGSAYSVYNFHFDPAYAADDLRGAVSHIEERWRPGDAVLINAGYAYPAFLYYYDGPIAWRGRLVEYTPARSQQVEGPVVLQTGTIGGSSNLGWGNPASDFYATTETQTAQALEEVFAVNPRLWVLRAYDTVTDPEGFIRRWLEEHGRQFDEVTVAGESNIRVQGYLTSGEPVTSIPAVDHPLAVSLGDSLDLLGFDGGLESVEAGRGIDLILYWRPRQPMSANYRVSMGLKDGHGHSWTVFDGQPIGPLYPTSQWVPGEVLRDPWRLIVPPGTPPGEYTLELGMYEPATGKELEVKDSRSVSPGVRVHLGSVRVVRPEVVVTEPLPAMGRVVGANFADRIKLLGYSLGMEQLRPGDVLHVDLFWQAWAELKDDYVINLQLRDRQGQVWVDRQGFPVDGTYPTWRWMVKELVRDQWDLVLPADIPDGRYQLQVALFSSANGQPLPLKRWFLTVGDKLTLGSVLVQGRPHSFTVPAGIEHPMEARLGETVQFLGYDLDVDSIQAGGTLRLTLYWRALREMDVSYKVFTHLIDGQDGIWGQKDSVPGGGTRPTTGWVEGEVLVDTYDIVAKPETRPGHYQLAIGMYEERTGQRLPIFDADGQLLGDRLLLAEIWVEER
ncbi:MAG: glycosyltransferase family 39 protein [Anaerolineae bacterium]